MNRNAILVVGLAALSGCGNFAQSLDEEVVSSLQYDGVDCERLVADRDALAASHGIATDGAALKPGERPKYLVVGLGTVLPDARGAREKQRRRAIGEVAAMDRSIERRECRGP